MSSAQRLARVAGVLYLLIAVVGAFSIAYVPSVIVVPGDAATTAANLMANRGLFAAGTVADVVVMLSEVALSVMLFVLLRAVSPTLSLIAMVSRLMMVAVMAINLLVNVMPLVLLSEAHLVSGLAPEQLQAAALVMFRAHQYGIYVWDIFFGFHLAVLGYLIFRSGYFPRFLGVVLMAGSPGYFLEGLRNVTFIDAGPFGLLVVGLLVVASIGELAFALWLLLRGPDVTFGEEKRAAFAAA
jgi:hypothetical protein